MVWQLLAALWKKASKIFLYVLKWVLIFFTFEYFVIEVVLIIWP